MNDDKTFGTCPEGISVYVKASSTRHLGLAQRSQRRLQTVQKKTVSFCPILFSACAITKDSFQYQCIDTGVQVDSYGECINSVFGASRNTTVTEQDSLHYTP
nr:hypothetical protein L203_05011 [Cryptococcus depauperatus CBS 7841]